MAAETECRTVVAKPGWFGRALRLVVGGLLAWFGIRAFQQADWLALGLGVAVAMPLVQAFGIWAVEAWSLHHVVLSSAQIRLGNKAYVIAVLVVVALLHSPTAAFGVLMFSFGLQMAVAGVLRYGGCEVMAVPNLLLRRNYVSFCCVFSPVDEAEQKATTWWSKRRRRT